jgi:hypothetical protein
LILLCPSSVFNHLSNATLRKLIKIKHKIELHHTTIYKIIDDELNISRKKLRKRYYPEKKLLTVHEDQKVYYKRILKQPINKVISISVFNHLSNARI